MKIHQLSSKVTVCLNLSPETKQMVLSHIHHWKFFNRNSLLHGKQQAHQIEVVTLWKLREAGFYHLMGPQHTCQFHLLPGVLGAGILRYAATVGSFIHIIGLVCLMVVLPSP